MAFSIPTLTEFRNKFIQNIKASLENIEIENGGAENISIDDNIFKKGLLYVLGVAFSGGSWLILKNIEFLSKQIFINSAENNYLDRHGIDLQTQRNSATPPTLKVGITGNSGSTIPSTATLISGVAVFKLEQSYEIGSDGTAEIEAVGVVEGVNNSVQAGLAISFTSPIVGVDSEATIASVESSGTEIETDSNYKLRLLAIIRRRALGGNPQDYKEWAENVAGVTRAFIYRCYNSSTESFSTATSNPDDAQGGVVGIMIAGDTANGDNTSTTIETTQAVKLAVLADAQGETRPAVAKAFVRDAVEYNIDIVISGSLNNSEKSLAQQAIVEVCQNTGTNTTVQTSVWIDAIINAGVNTSFTITQIVIGQGLIAITIPEFNLLKLNSVSYI